jgi:hypothetical protein
MPRKKRFLEKPLKIPKIFKISSPKYPFVVPATTTTVPFFSASNTAGCDATALAINRLPADGVTTNYFIDACSLSSIHRTISINIK